MCLPELPAAATCHCFPAAARRRHSSPPLQERSLRVYSKDRDPQVCAALNSAIDAYRRKQWGSKVCAPRRVQAWRAEGGEGLRWMGDAAREGRGCGR